MDLDILVFPTPDASYSWQNSSSELIYIPRFPEEKINSKSDSNKIKDNGEMKIKIINNNIKENNEILILDDQNHNLDDDNFKLEEKEINIEDFKKYYPITDSIATHIPCMYLPSNNLNSCKFAIFYHGNAEDINLAFEILNHIRFSLNINVLAPEYPGYGIYNGRPSEEGIFEDTFIVYDFLTKTLGISCKNIIIFGRSIGTAPSCFLASRKKIAGLVLISPMLS